MAVRKILALALATVMAVGVTPLLAQQTPGVISGSADDEAKKPYTDYSVQLRDVATGQVVSTTSLTEQGQFSFENVGLSQRFLVELVNLKDKEVVCTEGPYVLTPQGTTVRTDVNIACGKKAAALWILTAGAGTAAAVAFATQSSSE